MNQPSESASPSNVWRNCSLCKKGIPFGSTYYKCDVSTCNSKRVNMVFCAYDCWDGHLGTMRHRSAACEEVTAPTQ